MVGYTVSTSTWNGSTISWSSVVMQMAQPGAIEPLSQAVILASKADKLAPSSEPLGPA